MFYGQPRRHSIGAGPSVSNFGDTTYAQMVRLTAMKFCVLIRGARTCFHRRRSRGGGQGIGHPLSGLRDNPSTFPSSYSVLIL